jgi:hypothetical protein
MILTIGTAVATVARTATFTPAIAPSEKHQEIKWNDQNKS